MTKANVVLIGNNVTLSFDDIEANFAPAIKGSGECGVLYLAEPVDACSTLTNKVEKGTNYSSPFVLIIRGGCGFEEKVRRAQKAGFKAAIVYDNEDGGVLNSKLKSHLGSQKGSFGGIYCLAPKTREDSGWETSSKDHLVGFTVV
ncbi:receptor homology region transmembrane domain- and RING domain-containing protein 2 [Prunus yedoensis var. nudiflora]|uniref:Receptor homology region transmembrane domain-and RING domain-containing protein 2 n=1 Tax=Prunus yedoensis var. nudiflora TaxID=2094558 RepID=A0A314UMH5_PRUYE|nr:receptor homology region transmembrane domain- and RING domain-containing protein 2 [Prunus yedoensis var. nudiflora]